MPIGAVEVRPLGEQLVQRRHVLLDQLVPVGWSRRPEVLPFRRVDNVAQLFEGQL